MTKRARVEGRPEAAPPRPTSVIGDRGSVLLETALAIPLLMAVTVALAWGLSLAGTAASLGDVARTAARGLARGESADDIIDRARAEAPLATVTVVDAGDDVAVVVEQEVSAAGPILQGLSITVTRRVVVPREWS